MSETDLTGLAAKTARASKWAVLAEIASRSSGVVLLILTFILDPTDFGVLAFSTLVLSFGMQLLDFGMSASLIQTGHDTQRAGNVVFYVNIAFGCLAWACIALSADSIATLFHEPLVAVVLPVHCLHLMLEAFGSVHYALLRRDFGFRKLFWLTVATVFVPGLFSIPLALAGWRYWALVAGGLVGGSVRVVLLWRMSSWRPTWEFDREVARKLFRFGGWVTVEQILGWFSLWGDSLFLGLYKGTRVLGVYRVGSQLVNTVYGALVAPLSTVMYSTLCRLQGQPEEERSRAFSSLSRFVNLIVLLLALGFILAGPPAAEWIFGARWAGVEDIVRWVGIHAALSYLLNVPYSQAQALGRPDIVPKTRFILLPIQLVAFAIAAKIGLMPFLYTRVGVAVGYLIVYAIVLKRFAGIDIWRIFVEQRGVIMPSVLLCAAMWFLDETSLVGVVSPLARTLLLGFAALFGYATILLAFDRSFVRKILGVWRQSRVTPGSSGES